MAEPLKKMMNEALVEFIANGCRREYAAFPVQPFVRAVFDAQWEGRELKERIRHIAVCLRGCLPPDYREALAVLLAAFGAIKETSLEYVVFPEFVELYGLEDWEASLPALETFTRSSTAEFAVRPFFVQDQDRMMAQMSRWAEHDSEHVRRLASEGCRPRLPWAMGLPSLKRNPQPIVPVLERLKEDPSEYVRRSVANNLNDISKDHPDLVLELARAWHGRHPLTDKLLKHGCRTLLKQAHPEVLTLFGFGAEGGWEVRNWDISAKELELGGTLGFSFQLTNRTEEPLKLRLEYAVEFARLSGKTSRKQFRISETICAPGRSLHVSRKHAFADLSTRKHYPGAHRITLLVNGQPAAEERFSLR
ncbi:DNA alkylation repair protein [Paenibacillus sp. y28]